VKVDAAAEVVQFAFPQIYFACHTRHARRRSAAATLSDRDAQILAHLDREEAMTLTNLAAHLGLSASTLSEAVTHLAALDFVRKTRNTAGDRRSVAIVLTPKGVGAVRGSSVLETTRLRRVLGRLSPRERESAAGALAVLARACRPSGASVRPRGERSSA
jgi:DNA-binding MarR family transcriptional regulator